MTNAPFDDRDGLIWYDGEVVPWRDAKLHVLSHGLHYGGAVFEGERIYDGTVFKLREHSQRLIDSARMLDMEIPFSLEAIEDASKEILEANNISNGYLRPIAWRGSEQMAVSAQNTAIHLAFTCWQWPKYFFPKGGEDKGIALKSATWRRPDPQTCPVHAKAAGNYAIGTMAKHEAERAGFDDAFMLDYKGRVAESSGSNLFFIKDGAIKTPTAECFLNGITRQTVLQLARDMGISAEETTIMPDEIGQYEEIFVTGTAAEITPVGRIDDHTYEIGPLTKRLQEAYQDLTRQKPAAKTAASA
ncbi:MAG: branched-chain amino acid aminotransferase [Rhodospirillales bacterium]|nr:branched-chain amino acid aminotransferase [Rhodospirillales bacterium]MCB9995449.1 branched-chain amino acid aminotransferase [Rhodospirillales bacterium]